MSQHLSLSGASIPDINSHTPCVKEADAIANEALYAGGPPYSEENPGPNGETFSMRNKLDQTEFLMPEKAPKVQRIVDIGLESMTAQGALHAGREWLKQNGKEMAKKLPKPFLLSAQGLGKLARVKLEDGESIKAHFQAVASLPELLAKSEAVARTPDSQADSEAVAFYERRYAWGMFPDRKRRHVLLTVRYLTKAAEPPRMYSLEALEVRNAPEAFRDGTPGGQTASPSAATGLDESLSDFMAGVKPEHKPGPNGETFSLKKFDFSSRLAPAAAALQGMAKKGDNNADSPLE